MNNYLIKIIGPNILEEDLQKIFKELLLIIKVQILKNF